MMSLVAGMILVSAGSVWAAADAAKDVTLKGTMKCGKCMLHETKACADVLEVKDGDKTVHYYIAKNDVSKGLHKNVCHDEKADITVTGTVSEKDGKMTIAATKIEGL
jgi:hypothetical protein